MPPAQADQPVPISSDTQTEAPPGPLSIHVAARVAAAPRDAFAPIDRIGGKTGWYFGNRLWRIRGWIDRIVGGPGFRPQRPDELRVGAPLDSWLVEVYEPGKRLHLACTMKCPGKAFLRFDVDEDADGSVIRQTAFFRPAGLLGRVYWYSLWPLHSFIFRGILRRIAFLGARRSP